MQIFYIGYIIESKNRTKLLRHNIMKERTNEMDSTYSIPNGVYPVMLTPYTKDNQIDCEAVHNLVNWYAQNGRNGIFSLCFSSEIYFLSLNEKLKLLSETIKASKKLDKEMCIVASGHTGNSIEAQAEELTAVYETGADIVAWITNRLDIHNEGDKVWLNNAEKLLAMLPSDIRLGMYECPMPYKRLYTPEILKWARDTGKFYFIKDTCCDPEMIKERLEILKGSNLKLFNANAQTYLYSIRLGACGYSSVMSNFHPELYAWLTENPHHSKADIVQDLLCMSSFTESLHYPTTAKYYLNRSGVKMNLESRSCHTKDVTAYEIMILDQLAHMTDYIKTLIHS